MGKRRTRRGLSSCYTRPMAAPRKSSVQHAWIVVPTYNESGNLERMIRTLRDPGLTHAAVSTVTDPSARTARSTEIHVLVVDDASPDGTGAIADRLAAEDSAHVNVLHRAGKLGLGSAYVLGFQFALDHGADIVVQMDADFSHSPTYLVDMFDRFSDYDVVVGSRWAPGGSLDPRWERWRYLLSKYANRYTRWVTGVQVRDVTAGFKAFRADALRRLPLDRIRSEGYAFQVEMAVACHRLGLQIFELPIHFAEREIGSSKMSLRIIAEAMWRVWEIRFRP